MADAKISALTNLTAADAINDMIPIVDVSDTPPASGNTKRISINNILSSSPTASGALTVTGLVTAGSATITGAATVGTTLGVTGVSTFAAGTALLPALTTTGDTNTGIYYPAADTFAVTTGGTQRILVNSTGLNVGAGVQYARITSAGSNATGIANIENSAFASNGNSSLSCYIGHDGTNNRPFIQAATGNAGSAFSLLINPYGGDVSIGNGNVVMATSGKGIDFSATAGTGTSELLNDYEEGAFTPTIVGNTIAGVGVYGDQNGRYTKVGRLVTCQIFVNWTAHTGTGDMVIGGLPFATASISGIYHAATIGWANNIALTAGYILTGYAGHNASTIISLQQYPTGGGAMIPVPIDTLGGFIVSVSYIA
jgi:hypothetical protein